jgi:hypothetical protein
MSHRIIPIRSASYDAATETVTLRPVHRLPLRRTYMLTVLGTPPGGLTDTGGVFLDGAGTGRPGSDYVAVIDRKSLASEPERHKAGPGTGSGSAVEPRHKPPGDSTRPAQKTTTKGPEARSFGLPSLLVSGGGVNIRLLAPVPTAYECGASGMQSPATRKYF